MIFAQQDCLNNPLLLCGTHTQVPALERQKKKFKFKVKTALYIETFESQWQN